LLPGLLLPQQASIILGEIVEAHRAGHERRAAPSLLPTSTSYKCNITAERLLYFETFTLIPKIGEQEQRRKDRSRLIDPINLLCPFVPVRLSLSPAALLKRDER
jgi:hypothetical protein